jgi:hypothetical protein
MRRFTEFRHSEVKVAKVRKKLAAFEVSQKRIALLGRIADGWGAERTIFAEMPLHPALHEAFPGGEAGYREPLLQAAASLDDSPARFLELEARDFVVSGLWRDYFHLNSMGAMRFSDRLAVQVAGVLSRDAGTAP